MNPTLRENNYLHIPALIEAQRAEELAREFFKLEQGRRLTKDKQAPNSPAMYNFLPFVRLMVEKVPVVSELCEEPVLPTYTYARIYKHGEILARHRDRDACEISFTLNLAQDTGWPIYVEKPDGQHVAVDLNPGDAMMYLGCEAAHWRERFPGQNHVQLFMHYVRAYGPRAYAFFDKAKAPDAQHPQTELKRDTEPEVTGAEGDVAVAEKNQQRAAGGVKKVDRDESCPCGSGKKYKYCHGRLRV